MTLVTILTALGGCCSAVVFLELLINEDPECGNLVTFASFLFIVLEGFFNTTRMGTKKAKIPVGEWFGLVAIYFVVNVINNWALGFNIAMPLITIFKSVRIIRATRVNHLLLLLLLLLWRH
jgi:UDP-xylose/UDP-N-acetylglucosamine transporter B4